MKYSKLKEIVENEANTLKENAAYSGAWNDGGCSNLLQELANFKNDLVVKYNLKPSELSQLNDKEVSEPKEFSDIIEKYKLKIANDMIKGI